MRRIDARSGTENFKALFPTEFELLTKNPLGLSSGRGLNDLDFLIKFAIKRNLGYTPKCSK